MEEEQQQAMPTEMYFVPPPINELNKNYHQQLTSIDNPVSQATKSFVSYNQLYRLDDADAPYESQMVTEKFKEDLRRANKTLYLKMMEYLASCSGQASLDNIKNPAEAVIRQEIFKFLQMCQSVKRHETKKEICSIMKKQTVIIKARTKEILGELQEVKESLQNASANRHSDLKSQ